jgi:hypothetical protein
MVTQFESSSAVQNGNGRLSSAKPGEVDSFDRLKSLIAAIDLVQQSFSEWREARSRTAYRIDADVRWIRLELETAARLRNLSLSRDRAVRLLID